jgi:hypothetical protein
VEQSAPARGRCAARPLVAENGSVYFTGYSRPVDPGESRTDYTSFSSLPSTLAIGHKMGTLLQPPEYNLWFQRVAPGGAVEVLGEERDTVSFSRPLELDDSVVFSSGGDLIGYPKG